MGLGSFLGNLTGGNFSSALDQITGLFDSMPKEVASAGIFSAASLVSQMFGRDVEGDTLELARDKFEQDIINQRENLAFNREELAARSEMQKAAIEGQIRAAGISAGAQREIARNRNRLELGQTRAAAQEQAASRTADSLKGRPDLIMRGRSAQADIARANGTAGAQAFDALMRGIQNSLGGR